MSDPRTPWQPDQRKLGNWASMFDKQANEAPHPTQPASSPADTYDDAETSGTDPNQYRPWTLQRVKSRPAMMLALRRFDLKSGLWRRWSMSYPSLYALDVLGDRMLNLDFGGSRQFVLEGRGLDVLADHLQQGTVLCIVEYAASIWPTAGSAIVTGIKCLGQP